MYYIIFDKESKSYGDIINHNEEVVRREFNSYASSRDIDKSNYEVVQITAEELIIISEWFRKEYLMTTVDKFIVDRELKENK